MVEGGVLPAYTVRLKYVDGYDPHDHFGNNTNLTQVSSSPNVWDATKVQNSTNMEGWIGVNGAIDENLLEVIAANTTGVTTMARMFQNCRALTSVPRFDTSSCTTTQYMFLACYQLTSSPLFDTSSVTNMEGMFESCISLTSVPLLSTASCTTMDIMFKNCYNVESGALALYQQASEQTTPPASHSGTFTDCGRDSVAGSAELSQIPQDWGGTYSPADPYNPLNLPAYTIRIRCVDGYDASSWWGCTTTRVSESPCIWDITKVVEPENWEFLMGTSDGIIEGILEIMGANSTGVTSMYCSMMNCVDLTSVALFDTSSVTDMSYMLSGCTKVQSGALALYQHASTQATPPTDYAGAFENCGTATETGRAELAQIPSDWK